MSPVQVSACISESRRGRLARGETVSVDYSFSLCLPQPENTWVISTDFFTQNPVFGRSFIIWDQSSLAPLDGSAGKRSVYVDIADFMSTLLPATTRAFSACMLTDPACLPTFQPLSKIRDVIDDPDWTQSLGNAFASQYDLYVGDYKHSASLHRCLETLLHRVNDASYVQQKPNSMYNHANFTDEQNRVGLAKAMGTVATLSVMPRIFLLIRALALFLALHKSWDIDNERAALALIHGYAATYALTKAIEAQIEILVGSRILSSRLSDNKILDVVDGFGTAPVLMHHHGNTPSSEAYLGLFEKSGHISLRQSFQHQKPT
ncbi:unnamed protein product [Sphagnum tenellum]